MLNAFTNQTTSLCMTFDCIFLLSRFVLVVLVFIHAVLGIPLAVTRGF